MSMLTPREKIDLIAQVFTLLKLLQSDGALAGVILTNDSYDPIKQLFGDAKIPYRPAELDLDPQMNDTFVVDGLLILRGTQLQ